MIYNAILNDYGNVCDSFTIYIGLFVIAFLITIGISIYLCFSLVYKKVILVLLPTSMLILKQQFIKHRNVEYQANKH